ncbi:D-tyrosyl-tRNA(Tyr) deacylase [Candidatus Acetothermia bacterium]|nr:D-tyrosyl-tRNA(Tyr) deacylase [Candidatus Acetothermia bacterium]
MRIVLQRVKEASVTVDGKIVGHIEPGMLLLLGIGKGDAEQDVSFLADKVLQLRIFADAEDKMNLSIQDVKGEILVVSQFTLYGDCRRGRRPGFDDAAPPETARALYELFVRELKKSGLKVETGIFAARMDVKLTNDGPVTFILESRER